MSGCAFLFFEHVRAKQLEIHQPRLWYAVVPPLRNSASRYVAHFSNSRRAAKVINDFVRVHAAHLSRLRLQMQPAKNNFILPGNLSG